MFEVGGEECCPRSLAVSLALTPPFFSRFLARQPRHCHHTSVSIGGRPIWNLRFADDIDLMGGSIGEIQDLTNRPVNRVTAYAMEVNTEMSKIMTESTNNISADILERTTRS